MQIRMRNYDKQYLDKMNTTLGQCNYFSFSRKSLDRKKIPFKYIITPIYVCVLNIYHGQNTPAYMKKYE